MYNVLIVDDEIWMCEGFKKILQKLDCGFNVIEVANNGQQALAKLEANSDIDVVVTDIQMPRMDGLEFIERMRGMNFTQPVIIVSAYNHFEYARKAMRFGVIDYLLKPIKDQEVKDVFTNLHEQLDKDKSELKDSNSKSEICIQDVNSGPEIVQYVLNIIEHSYNEDLSLSFLADKAGFNASYLSRLFKLETGVGFVQYLREVRMKHACQLLKETRLTNKEVANQVGFWDEKHFRRTFKKDLGVTPSEFRENVSV